jgi:hypothetical protein
MDNGETWDVLKNTSWVSYMPELFDVDWSGYGGPEYDENDDPVFNWENGSEPNKYFSENAFPTMSMNTHNGQFILQWLNQYMPLIQPDGGDPIQAEALTVFTLVRNLTDFPECMNIQDIWKDSCKYNLSIVENPRPIINTKIYPNPANSNVTITLDTNDPYTLTVTNIMGQVVYSMQGKQNMVNINVANYPAGIYIVNVRTTTATTSQKLIVR